MKGFESMFMGYPISQWIGVLEWMILIIIIFVGAFTISCIIENKLIHKNKRKNNYRTKKNKKKSWFINVA